MDCELRPHNGQNLLHTPPSAESNEQQAECRPRWPRNSSAMADDAPPNALIPDRGDKAADEDRLARDVQEEGPQSESRR